MERDAVEIRHIGAGLGHGLRQCLRTEQEGKMPGVGCDVVFVLCPQISVHGGNAFDRRSPAAALRCSQLYRCLDCRKTCGGKKTTVRVGDDGGLNPRVVRDGLRREFLPVNLLASRVGIW